MIAAKIGAIMTTAPKFLEALKTKWRYSETKRTLSNLGRRASGHTRPIPLHFLLAQNGIKPKSILHVGANRGQEVRLYNSLGIEGWHVEAIPSIYEKYLLPECKNFPDQHPINACLSNVDETTVKFNISSNKGASSSFLNLGRHAITYPSVKYVETIELRTKTIDTLVSCGTIPESIEFLLIDAQGAEALILDGAQSLLSSKSLLACLIETSVVPLYEGVATFIDICQRLSKFELHLRRCVFNQQGWTDALFMGPWWPQKN